MIFDTLKAASIILFLPYADHIITANIILFIKTNKLKQLDFLLIKLHKTL